MKTNSKIYIRPKSKDSLTKSKRRSIKSKKAIIGSREAAKKEKLKLPDSSIRMET